MATRVAGRRCIPQRTLAYQATMAPQVTISPWAKLVSPVVPKISDRPTAQMAMTRPNLMPSKMSCGTRSRSLSDGPLAGAEVEDQGPALAGQHLDLPPLVALGEADAVGQRVDVEDGDVGAGPGEPELEAPVLVADGGADLLTVERGDEDLDVGHRLVVVAVAGALAVDEVAADELRGLALAALAVVLLRRGRRAERPRPDEAEEHSDDEHPHPRHDGGGP